QANNRRCLALLGGGADVAPKGNRAEVGMRVEINNVGIHHAVEDLGRIKGRQVGHLALDGLEYRVFEGSAELLDMADGDRVNDGLLVGKEAVQRPDRHLSLGGDAGGRKLVQRHLLQQGAGGVEHALDGLQAAALYGDATAEGED